MPGIYNQGEVVMECACIDVGPDWDCGVESIAGRVVVARKEHTCGECRQAIKAGDKYRNEVFKFEGDIERYKTCMDCMSLREEVFCSFYYGRLWDDLEDELSQSEGQLAESCIADLTPRARDWVCEIIEKVWERLDARPE